MNENNAELRAIFNETNIIGILKIRRISWGGHVWRAEGQIVHTSHYGNQTRNGLE